ncbi:MAG: glycosyltransferase family 1 protein [Flavobacterium sp.]|nr:MAG: glycosyltransferase family 1 protein [Flavobacterium sp.]
MKKVIRTSTVALSLDFLLKGQLDFLNKHYDVVALSGDDEHLQEVTRREKVRTINLPMQRRIAPIADLISLFKLYKTFRKEKPFIVHSITPKAGLLSMTAAYFACVPVRAHTFTGLIFPSRSGFSQKLLILMDRILCRFATNIYPEGQGVKNDLQSFEITKKPLKILANGGVNGIDTDYFSRNHFSESENIALRNSLAIDADDFVFIFVGRLVRDKGINELIAAFSKFDDVKIKLLLVGPFENELDPLSASTLDEIKSNPNIISVGFQTDVRKYFAISDALVFPSYREGFPNVVLQAGAMDLPVIATNINGSNEIISDGENGILIPVKDESAISSAMLALYQNKQLFQKLQKNARQMIASRYEQSVVWQAILNEYRTFGGE